MHQVPDTGSELREFPAIRVTGDNVTEVRDVVSTEAAFRLYVNDRFPTELLASPVQLKELGVGFVICEGLSSEVGALRVAGNEIRVPAQVEDLPGWVLASGGGMSSKEPPQEARSSLTIQPGDVSRMVRGIRSEAWKRTGAVHCSALFFQGELVVRSCDVGRHNESRESRSG